MDTLRLAAVTPDPSLLITPYHRGREVPRCMYPGEFVATLRRHLHPRFYSTWVERNRWGERGRSAVGLPSHGTIIFAPVDGDTEEKGAIPANCIPYTTVREATWNEARRTWEYGDMLKGWRSVLSDLVKSGHLRASERLSYLIGEDTKSLPAKWFLV